MNERFKELLYKTNIPLFPLFPGKDPAWVATNHDMEKFALLIVRECIKCCDDLERTNQHYISKFGIDPDIRPKQCIEVIKQHFGVEE